MTLGPDGFMVGDRVQIERPQRVTGHIIGFTAREAALVAVEGEGAQRGHVSLVSTIDLTRIEDFDV